MSADAGAPGPAFDRAAFHEEQRFRQPVLLAVVALAAAVQWALVVYYLLLGGTFDGDRPALVGILLPWLVVGVGLPLLLWRVALVTDVGPDAVVVGFAPFNRRTVPLADLTSSRVLRYRPIRDFGGWGARWSADRRAYTAGGRDGVELTLQRGQRIVIGSRRAGELAAAIERGSTA